MKIDELILLHFHNKKEFSLQGIGTFRLRSSDDSFLHNSAEINSPQNSITFHYNPKVSEDALLVETISIQTKKIKSLASADLNSFIVWETQLLNIGMAFTLKGIGTLEKTKEGELKFIPLPTADAVAEKGNTPKKDKKKIEPGLPNPANYRPAFKVNIKKALAIASITIIVGTLVWAIYYLITQTKSNEIVPAEKNESIAVNGSQISKATLKDLPSQGDTLNNISRAKDTVSNAPLLHVTATKENVDYVFKVVFLETKSKEEALQKYNEIVGFGHSASMYTKDSSIFQIAIAFNLPLGDTSRIIDSLDQFYSLGKGVIDMK